MSCSDLRDSQWIEIRSAALRSNLSLFRGLVSQETQLAAVVKANAYGHGLAEVVEAVSGQNSSKILGPLAESSFRKNAEKTLGFVCKYGGYSSSLTEDI